MRLVNESLIKDKWEQAEMFWNRIKFMEIYLQVFVILDLIYISCYCDEK